jgi:hypothetical protein
MRAEATETMVLITRDKTLAILQSTQIEGDAVGLTLPAALLAQHNWAVLRALAKSDISESPRTESTAAPSATRPPDRK